MTKEERITFLKQAIETARVMAGLNLTVYNGKIGFVDQEERKIVALWSPEFSIPEQSEGKVIDFPAKEENT